MLNGGSAGCVRAGRLGPDPPLHGRRGPPAANGASPRCRGACFYGLAPVGTPRVFVERGAASAPKAVKAGLGPGPPLRSCWPRGTRRIRWGAARARVVAGGWAGLDGGPYEARGWLGRCGLIRARFAGGGPYLYFFCSSFLCSSRALPSRRADVAASSGTGGGGERARDHRGTGGPGLLAHIQPRGAAWAVSWGPPLGYLVLPSRTRFRLPKSAGEWAGNAGPVEADGKPRSKTARDGGEAAGSGGPHTRLGAPGLPRAEARAPGPVGTGGAGRTGGDAAGGAVGGVVSPGFPTGGATGTPEGGMAAAAPRMVVVRPFDRGRGNRRGLDPAQGTR
jgi:hypothetical protein